MSVQPAPGKLAAGPPPNSTPTLNHLLRMPPGTQTQANTPGSPYPQETSVGNGPSPIPPPAQYLQPQGSFINRNDKAQSYPVTNGAWMPPGQSPRPPSQSGDGTHPTVAALRQGTSGGSPVPHRSPSATGPGSPANLTAQQHHSPVSPAPLPHGATSQGMPDSNGGHSQSSFTQPQQSGHSGSFPHANHGFVQQPFGYPGYDPNSQQPPQGYYPPSQGQGAPVNYHPPPPQGFYGPGSGPGFPPRGPSYPSNQYPSGYAAQQFHPSAYPPPPGSYNYPRPSFEGSRPMAAQGGPYGVAPQPSPAANGPTAVSASETVPSTSAPIPRTPSRTKTSGPKDGGGSLPSTPGTGTQSPGGASGAGEELQDTLSSPSWPQTPVSQSPGARQGTPAFQQPTSSTTPKPGKEAKGGSIIDNLVGNAYTMPPQELMVRRQFYETLVGFTEGRAHPLTCQPTVSKQPVDLFNLYNAVRERGGFEQVTKYKKWKQLCSLLGLRESSNIGVQIRKRYMQFLLEYECERDGGGRSAQELVDLVERMKKPKYAKPSKKSAANGDVPPGFPQPPPPAALHQVPMEGMPPGSWPAQTSQMNGPYPPSQLPYGHPGHMVPQSMPPPRMIPPGGVPPHPGPPPPASGEGVVARDPFDDGNHHSHPYYSHQPLPPHSRTTSAPNAAYYQPYPSPARSVSYAPAYSNVPASSESAQAQTPPQFASPAMAPTPPASASTSVVSSTDSSRGPGPAPQYSHSPFGAPTANYHPGNSMPSSSGIPPPHYRNNGPYPPVSHAGSGGTESSQSAATPPYVHPPSQPSQAPSQPPQQYPPQWHPSYQPTPPRPGSQYQMDPSVKASQGGIYYPPQHPSGSFNQAHAAPSKQQSNYQAYGRIERGHVITFPPGSVESSQPSLRKRRKLNHRDVGKVDPWRLMMALKSGLIAETTWALNVLNVLLYDDATVSYFGLKHLPGLLEVLVEHFQKSLVEVFPNEEFDELESGSLQRPSCNLEKKEPSLENNERLKISKEIVSQDGEEAQTSTKDFTWETRTGRTVRLDQVSSPLPEAGSNTSGNKRQEHIIGKFWEHLDESSRLRFGRKRKTFETEPSINADKTEPASPLKGPKFFFRENEGRDIDNAACSELEGPRSSSLNERTEWKERVANRCLALSNILRGLVIIPGNEGEMAKQAGLIMLLGKILRLKHRHLSARPKYSRAVAEDNEEIREDVVSEGDWDESSTSVLREDAFAMLCQISAQLDLSRHEEIVVRPLLDSLLHWTVCSSTAAKDLLLPGTISPLRYSLEALCKLSVLERNVDLLLATPPWSRTEKMLQVLSGLLNIAEDVPVREFSLVMVHALCAASHPACVTTALRTPAVQHLVAFLEGADASMHTVVSTHGMQALRENPELMGTSVGMLRRAASVLQCLSKVPACRQRFIRHQQRLLQFTMSQLMDSRVAGIIADTLFELQKPASPLVFPMNGSEDSVSEIALKSEILADSVDEEIVGDEQTSHSSPD